MLQRSFRWAGAFTALISVFGVTSGNMSQSIAADRVGASTMETASMQPAQVRAIPAAEPCYCGKDIVSLVVGAAVGDQAKLAPEVAPTGDDGRDTATNRSAAADLLRFELGEQFLNAIRMDPGKRANHMPVTNAFLHVVAIASATTSSATALGFLPDAEDGRQLPERLPRLTKTVSRESDAAQGTPDRRSWQAVRQLYLSYGSGSGRF